MAKKKNKIPPFLIMGGIGLVGWLATRKQPGEYKNLEKFFSKEDVTKSHTATSQGLDMQFNPRPEIYENADFVAKWFLNPLAKKYGREAIETDSWYRSPQLNVAVGGVPNSFHIDAFAVDTDLIINGQTQNDLILDFIVKNNIPFTELGLEYGTISNPDTIHYAYVPGRNEKQVFRMTQSGTTVHDYSYLTDRFG